MQDALEGRCAHCEAEGCTRRSHVMESYTGVPMCWNHSQGTPCDGIEKRGSMCWNEAGRSMCWDSTQGAHDHKISVIHVMEVDHLGIL